MLRYNFVYLFPSLCCVYLMKVRYVDMNPSALFWLALRNIFIGKALTFFVMNNEMRVFIVMRACLNIISRPTRCFEFRSISSEN